MGLICEGDLCGWKSDVIVNSSNHCENGIRHYQKTSCKLLVIG